MAVNPPTHAQRMNLAAFVGQFIETERHIPDQRYCWILGAGASVTSGIPAGGDFARRWFNQIYVAEGLDDESREVFAQRLPALAYNYEINLNGLNLLDPGLHYSEIYDYRFRDDPLGGFAQLEEAMRDKDPGLGYTILSRFLEKTRHRVVITTNFDNLVADAVAIHTNVFPMVCGHESHAGYLKLRSARPLVLKIHRDLLLGPLSRKGELGKLHDDWQPILDSILTDYIPIVIGYDGNDGTLMPFLRQHASLAGRLFWCHRVGREPREEIHQTVTRHRGRLVAIEGFDELLFRLGGPLELTDPLTAMRERYERRVNTYIERLAELEKKVKEPPRFSTASPAASAPLRQVIEQAVAQATKAVDWVRKARRENDPEKREALYRRGLKAGAESSELAGNYAEFLSYTRKDYDRAEAFYRKALDLDPNDATHTANYANFLHRIRKDHDQAEALYRRALELDPNHATITGKYAEFLLERGRWATAAERILHFWKLAWPKEPECAVVAAFQRVLLACGQNTAGGRNDGAHRSIGILKHFLTLSGGIHHTTWRFDVLIASLSSQLTGDRFKLARALAAAINDPAKVAALDAFPEWMYTRPTAPTADW